MSSQEYSPSFFGADRNREDLSPEQQFAHYYLQCGDLSLRADLLRHVGDVLVNSKDHDLRYLGAWAYLEAAQPGLFSMEEPAQTNQSDTSTAELNTRAFDVFSALQRRTPYVVEPEDMARRSINNYFFGIRAQLTGNLKPSFSTPDRYRNGQITQKVAENYAQTAVELRRQDERLTAIRRNLSANDGEIFEKTAELQGRTRGLEVENMLLGLSWTDLSNGGDLLLLPASPRLDFAFKEGSEPVDIIAIDRQTEEHLGISTKRDAYYSRKNGYQAPEDRRILELYGDRDLGLEPMISRFLYEPGEFTGFDPRLARRVMTILERRFEEIRAETPATTASTT